MIARRAGLWLGLASACLVVALAVLDARSSSPGAITAAHARSAGIDEDDCAVCHGGSPSEMRAACAACHADVEAQVVDGSGFHGRIADVARCGRCHVEHHGAELELAGAGAFALAGVADRARYAHEGLAFDLGGDHVGRACKDCHEHADDTLLADGARRFLGESTACASCHDDPHEGRLADCRSCHGETEPFDVVAEFEHPASFALAGAHARAGCVECHPRGSAHAIEAGGGERATREPRACGACHASPHAESFVAPHAADPAASCASCHPVERGAFAQPKELSAADHAATGFALVAPHDRASCVDCHPRLAAPAAHGGAFADWRAAHPGRSPDDCAACHDDPHGGQFAGGASADRGCLACHARERFAPPEFGVERHAKTAFALTGAHVATSCDACHAKVGDSPRRFAATDARCSACHADAHAGLFAARAVDASSAARAEDCASCHTTADFGDVASFDHFAATGFALVGEHAAASCESCHAPRARPDENGRSFGVVAESFPGAVDDCATCHVDVHGGYFARGPRAQACSSCHAPHAFERARDGFDHARATGFALDGAHARAACAVCHPGESAPPPALVGRTAPATRTTARERNGSFADCTACHADVHAGAFERAGVAREIAGRTGCARCHTTESFSDLRADGFDHARSTGFALVGAHARAECSSCHPRDAAASGAFAHAAGTRCQDCHADPHVGQFAREAATDCARCHASEPDFLALRFDHARDSRFALDATHARLACSACHVPWPIPGGGTAVRYKPLGVVCGDCHDARAGEPR